MLYAPHALHTLCGTINSPHLLHFTSVGADIFQFARLLSLLPLEDLFLGQMDISHTSLSINRTFAIINASPMFCQLFFYNITFFVTLFYRFPISGRSACYTDHKYFRYSSTMVFASARPAPDCSLHNLIACSLSSARISSRIFSFSSCGMRCAISLK